MSMSEDYLYSLESGAIEQAAYARLAIECGDTEDARYHATRAAHLALQFLAEGGTLAFLVAFVFLTG